MVRKPAKMYRTLAKKAYTRREYMGGVPGSKIVQFEMGNLSGEFPHPVRASEHWRSTEELCGTVLRRDCINTTSKP